MLLVVVTRERCVEMCTMGQHLKQAKWQEYHPQRSDHSAPLLPQVLVSQTVSLLPTFWKPMLRKGIRPSLLVGGDGWERQGFESCKRMAAWETLFKPRTGQAYGSVWPPRRKGYWVGLHRLQAEPQDPEAADLMGFPLPTRQRRCRCSKCWRITVAWIMGMLVKHMRNHNLRSASPPYTHHRILPGSGRRELQMRNCVPVLTWQSSLRLRRKNSTHPRLSVKNLVYYLAIRRVWKHYNYAKKCL